MAKIVALTKLNTRNLLLMINGILLFKLSFVIGEGSVFGTLTHLSGCAFFCAGVHRKWCSNICESNEKEVC